jgi:hypothetical protein
VIESSKRVATGLLDRPVRLIGAVLALRFGLVLLLFATQLFRHNGWYFPNDDQEKYYPVARALVDGKLHPTIATIGYDLFLLPFAASTGFVLQAIPPVAVAQAALAVPAAWLLYRAGLRLYGPRAGTLASAIWCAAPLAALLYIPTSHGPVAIWLGLKILTDYLGALFVIAATAIAAGTVDDDGWPRALAAGAVAGAAMLTKPTNGITVAAIVVAFLVWRRVRAAIVALGAAIVVFVPQLVVNQRFFGSPLDFGYQPSVARRFPTLSRTVDEGAWSPLNIPRTYGRLVLSNATGPLILFAAALALFVAWRRFPSARVLVVGQAAAFAVILPMYHYSIGDHFLRIASPLIPLVALAAGAALVTDAGARRPAKRLPHGSRAVVVAALAVAAGLSAWLAVMPASPLLQLETLRPAASQTAGTVTLRWRRPSAPARLSYQVTRASSLTVPAGSFVRGFHWSFEQPKRAIPVRHGTTFIDHPPPGTWWYRVLITPAADPDAWPPGVPVVASPPVRVVVR